MASNTSPNKATHPFYSAVIRTALLQLAQTDPSQSTRTTSSGVVTSPYSDDSGGGSNLHRSDSSESDESSANDKDGDEMDQILLDQLIKQPHAKKSHTKKVKSGRSIKLNNAPSIILPLPHAKEDKLPPNKPNLTVSIPTILLPQNYLRTNPNYDTSDAASHLLTTWEALNNTEATIIIVLLASGRFAAAVYTYGTSAHHPNGHMTMLAHKTSTRYTVRKGQGGSQSQHDGAKHKAKSMGAQLRREGERQLRLDVVSTWKEWRKDGHVDNALGVYVSVPKGMRRDYLFGGEDGTGSGSALVDKNDERIRSIPLDCGRPTLEAVDAVMECVLRCEVGEMSSEEEEMMMIQGDEVRGVDDGGVAKDSSESGNAIQCTSDASNDATINVKELEQQLPVVPPLTPLHEAVITGDLDQVKHLLQILEQSEAQESTSPLPQHRQQESSYDINTPAGPEHQTPLHLASSSTHDTASAIVNILLLQGRANPCAIDSRGRPPYYLASSDKIREAFRSCRATLGEDYCSWDADAKVGPALTANDIEVKKAKALEKKRRQRARQKEKKAAEAEAAAKLKKEEEVKKQEEDAKRIRDGLKPKASTAGKNLCDFCQKAVKKGRNSMFQRLQYAYCSTECVKRHQRELAAAAATARMGL